MSEPVMPIEVACYAGFRGEETPRHFSLGDRQVAVREIIDRWLAPEHRYFKVRGDDGAIYLLRHDTATAQWELVMYLSGDRGQETGDR